jgi:hypothetical protein
VTIFPVGTINADFVMPIEDALEHGGKDAGVASRHALNSTRPGALAAASITLCMKSTNSSTCSGAACRIAIAMDTNCRPCLPRLAYVIVDASHEWWAKPRQTASPLSLA